MRFMSKIVVLAGIVPTALGITFSIPMNSSAETLPVLLPFHAVIQGNANPFPIDACTLGNHETGSGRALHFGKITWSSDETAHFLSCSPPSPPGPAIAVFGKFKILAANGDEIDCEYQTTGTFDPVNGVSVQGGYTLISGTGRFTNVTGGGAIAAEGAASPPFEFVASLNGTISKSAR
jgi:hypothetical protein